MDKKNYSTKNVLEPENGLTLVMRSMWIYCENGDPTKAVFYRKTSLQGNSDKRIMENFPKPYPGCELVYFDRVFIPVDHDYSY